MRKRSKYGVFQDKKGRDRRTVDNILFHSQYEAQCYVGLKMLEKAGKISGLELQPSFEIHVNGILICKYVGDFRYIENGREVIADAKGFRTREYIYKKRLMLAVHGIEIREL